MPTTTKNKTKKKGGRRAPPKTSLSQAMKNAKKDWAQAKAKGKKWLQHVKDHLAKIRKKSTS